MEDLQKRFDDLSNTLSQGMQESVEKHGAIHQISGHNFIGYTGKTGEKWWCDVYSWGVHHGKIHGNTQDEVEELAYSVYDNIDF